MTDNMVPCQDPSRCGVKSHRRDTYPLCATKNTKSAAGAAAQVRLSRPVQPVRSQEEVAQEFNQDDILQLLREREELGEREERVGKLGKKQLESHLRKQLGLGSLQPLWFDQYDLIDSDKESIEVYVGDADSESSRKVALADAFPDKATKGKVSLPELTQFRQDFRDYQERTGEILDYGKANIKGLVPDHVKLGPRDSLSVDDSVLLSDADTITVHIYRGADDDESFEVSRSEVFPG